MSNIKASKIISDTVKAMAKQGDKTQVSKLFKTGYGEYAQGDKFLGVSTNYIKIVAKQFSKATNISQAAVLLCSQYHELRRTGVEILVCKMQNEKDEKKQEKIVDCYLKNFEHINNWDLVDASAPHIVGEYLLDKDKTMLYDFAAAENIWKQRAAIVATLPFIRENKYEDTLAIAEMLMDSPYDLVQKACGWMLREIGKQSSETELRFLDKYAATMPRTTLRYAIEKFDTNLREYYMSLKK